MLALIAVGGAGRAMARETHAGFNVRVHVVASGHAAAIPKSVAATRTASATPFADELRFSLSTGAGYFVRFEVLDPAVEQVEIRGLGRAITIGSGAREVFVPSSSEQAISYRVKVRAGARLGAGPPVRATLLP